MLNLIEESKNQPIDQSIPKLGQWIRQLNSARNTEKGDRPVFRAAQSALISIPGHAEYYANRINENYEKALKDAKRSNTKYLSFDYEWSSCFQTLRHLPSPETVRVLGEMLDDMRITHLNDSHPKDWRPSGPSPPHGTLAARVLTDMELSGAPMKQPKGLFRDEIDKMTAEEYYNMDVEPWRLWYAQVKAGTRTFRFKNDPQEYSLDGPVRMAVAPSSPRENTDDANPAEETSRSSPWPLIGSLLALAAAGGWYVFQKKQPA